MPMKKLSYGAELWLDLWIKISLKLSWIVLFNKFEHKKTQIVIIQALINIKTTLDFEAEIVGAGSLNIQTCKNNWESVTSHKLAGKPVSRKKKWKGSVLVVLAWNLFYNWCLFYTNLSSEISIENYCDNKFQN